MIRKRGCFNMRLSDTVCALMYTVSSHVWFVSCSLLMSSITVAQLHSVSRMFEQTIAGPIEFTGIGLHTGEHATVRILPAPAGKGVIFRRIDLDNFELRADVASVARVAYATTLMSRGVWISTVEHMLSALYGVGIDNAYIELDNFEVPILDGSALPFTEAITRVGILSQDKPKQYLRITKEFVLNDGEKTLGIYPSDVFAIQYDINFPHPLIGKQRLEIQFTGTNYSD